ncbi:hypothetical protein CsatB_023664 [Cannabis sativa]
MFGCDKYNIKPDLVTVAKDFSSAYLPIAAALVSPEVSEVISKYSEASCSNSGSPILVAANFALYGVVESNSQVTNRQMENIEQCNDTSHKGIKTLKELHGFVGVDELCPGKVGPPNTAIKFSIEDAEFQMNDTNL